MLAEPALGQHRSDHEQCRIEDRQRNGVFDNKRSYRIGDHIEEVVRIERQIREKKQDMVRNIVVQVGHHHRTITIAAMMASIPIEERIREESSSVAPSSLALMSLRYEELWNNFWKMLQGTARPPHP